MLALEHARKLLSQRLLAPAQRLLGHLYAAEALVLLDRADEALEHLSPELSGESGGRTQERAEESGGTGRTPTAGVFDGERAGDTASHLGSFSDFDVYSESIGY